MHISMTELKYPHQMIHIFQPLQNAIITIFLSVEVIANHMDEKDVEEINALMNPRHHIVIANICNMAFYLYVAIVAVFLKAISQCTSLYLKDICSNQYVKLQAYLI